MCNTAQKSDVAETLLAPLKLLNVAILDSSIDQGLVYEIAACVTSVLTVL